LFALEAECLDGGAHTLGQTDLLWPRQGSPRLLPQGLTLEEPFNVVH
jgi:hypothetical protein